MSNTPFESIESAHHYVTLLGEQLCQVKEEIRDDVTRATEAGESRQVDVLRLVEYKLTQLRTHLSTSARLLNDLRTLRRLLLGEREDTPRGADDESSVSARARA